MARRARQVSPAQPGNFPGDASRPRKPAAVDDYARHEEIDQCKTCAGKRRDHGPYALHTFRPWVVVCGDAPRPPEPRPQWWHVVISLSHDMGEFVSTELYTDDESEKLVMKLRKDGINCHARPQR